MTIGTTLATGVQAAIGGRYDVANNRLIFAAFYGFVSAVVLPTASTPAQLVQLGSGYANPEDVLPATRPGTGAPVVYLSDRVGAIYALDPAVPDGFSRAAAQVLADNLVAPQQMALAGNGQALYVVEYVPPGTGSGRLLQVPLTGGGGPTAVLSDVEGGVGVAVRTVGGVDTIYLVEQGPGTLAEVDPQTGVRTPLVAGLPGPFFISWRDAGQTQLLLPLRDPGNRVMQVDLTQLDPSGRPRVTRLVDGLPWRPSCAAMVAGELVVFADREIIAFDLSSGPRVTVPRGAGGGGAFFGPRFDPTDSTRRLVASDMGELYVSRDAGTSWSMQDTRDVTGYRRFSGAFVPGSGGRIVAAHRVRGLRTGVPDAAASTGTTWSDFLPQLPLSFQPYDPSRPSAAAVSPDGQVLLLGMGAAGVFRWDFQASPPPAAWPAPFVPQGSGSPEDLVDITWASPTAAAAATEDGVYLTIDRGLTWTALEPTASALPPGPANGTYDADTSRVLSLAAATAGGGGGTVPGTVVVWVTTPRPGSAVYRCDVPPAWTPGSPPPAWQRIAAQADVEAAVWQGANLSPPGPDSVLFRRVAVAPGEPDTVHVAIAVVSQSTPRPAWNVLSATRSGAGYTWRGSFVGSQAQNQQPWRDLNGDDVGWVEPQRPQGLGFGFGGAATGLAVDATGQQLFYVNFAGVYEGTALASPARWRQRFTQPVPTAAGRRWRTTGADDTTVWHYVVSGQRHFLANTDIGLLASEDAGDTWQLSNGEYNTVYDLAVAGNDVYAAVSTEHDLGSSSWWNKALGDGAVLVSSNGGAWTPSRPRQLGPVTGLCMVPPSAAAALAVYAAVFGFGVSRFDGTSWQPVPSAGLPAGPLPPSPLPTGWDWSTWHPATSAPYVYQVGTDAAGRLLCLVTRNTTDDGTGAGLYRFDGTSWTELSSAVAQQYSSPSLFHPVSFTCHPTDPDSVWLCVSAVRGTNGPGRAYLGHVPAGQPPSWNARLTYAMLQPPPAFATFLSVFSVAYDPQDPAAATLYAATGTHGVLVTTNASSANPAWSPVSAVPFLNTQRVAFDSADPGTLYVTTHGGGAWRTMKPSTAAAWQQRIRRSAYDLYLRRGDSPGSALDDWVAAERLVLDDAVQRRAYERYLHRGRAAGGDLDDWLGAEREIRSSLR